MLTRLSQALQRRGWDKPALAWALYDWGNSAFATVVIAGLYPIFYRNHWARNLPDDEITFTLAAANSVASLLLIFSAPLLGPLADRGGAKKKLLAACALPAALATMGFALITQNAWQFAAACYVFAVFLFMLGNVFYDALLVDVAEPRRYDRISAGGFALGYLGGGLMLAFSAWMILNADRPDVGGESGAMRTSFILVGLWWLVFTLPLLAWTRERRRPGGGVSRVRETLRLLRAHPAAAWFLLAYWLYIDGVDTIIRMAVNYGQVLGFSIGDLIAALLLVQFVGFPATLIYGRLAERFGARRMIIAGILVYLLICTWGALLQSVAGFYSLVILIGLVQGGLQSQSRSFFAAMIPTAHAAQFFSLYNLLGKFAALIGPLVLGIVGSLTGSPRLGLLSVGILLLAGLAVLVIRVPRDRP